jgi:queuine tRNA-ribosyltransferase
VFKFEVIKQSKKSKARIGKFSTPNGAIKTPVFMPVGTMASVKGLSPEELVGIGSQIILANTYHLYLRPGHELIKAAGGLHKFMNWDKPILTDSGGFQVFSLSKMRKVTDDGVYFDSFLDGSKHFLTPERSIEIQKALGADIIMAFDECIPAKASRDYVKQSAGRTSRWLLRCVNELNRLSSGQQLFGINQGGLFHDIRIEHARTIAETDLPGYAIGGLAVGESHEEMYGVIETVTPHLPRSKPVYLMGVGTPANIVEAVYRGVDFFDCVMPARNGRHGHVYTWNGKMNLFNKQYETDSRPIDENCGCPVCVKFSRAYIRHLFKAGEILAMRLCVLHNLFFYNSLMEETRLAIIGQRFYKLRSKVLESYLTKP